MTTSSPERSAETDAPTDGARPLTDDQRRALIRAMGWDPERVSLHHPVFAAPAVVDLTDRATRRDGVVTF